MIAGVGIDAVSISRIKKAMENPRFLERNFTEKERLYFSAKQFAPQSVAANFAAKEAFSKALGTGFSGFSLSDISVERDALGKPILSLIGAAKKIAEEKGANVFHVSLTHTETLATAIVIAEQKESAL